MPRSRKAGVVGGILVSLVCCVGVVLVLTSTNFARGLYSNLVLDNREHYLDCEELPPLSEVERVVKEHTDIFEDIKRVKPGFVYVEIDSTTCPGKADIVISYGTHQDRLAIEAIIVDDTFFGVPYRLRNN